MSSLQHEHILDYWLIRCLIQVNHYGIQLNICRQCICNCNSCILTVDLTGYDLLCAALSGINILMWLNLDQKIKGSIPN